MKYDVTHTHTHVYTDVYNMCMHIFFVYLFMHLFYVYVLVCVAKIDTYTVVS